MSKVTPYQTGRLCDILDYLRDHPGATQTQIMQVLGITRKSHLQKYLDLARANGLVRYCGGPGRSSRGYELTQGPPSLSQPDTDPPQPRVLKP